MKYLKYILSLFLAFGFVLMTSAQTTRDVSNHEVPESELQVDEGDYIHPVVSEEDAERMEKEAIDNRFIDFPEADRLQDQSPDNEPVRAESKPVNENQPPGDKSGQIFDRSTLNGSNTQPAGENDTRSFDRRELQGENTQSLEYEIPR